MSVVNKSNGSVINAVAAFANLAVAELRLYRSDEKGWGMVIPFAVTTPKGPNQINLKWDRPNASHRYIIEVQSAEGKHCRAYTELQPVLRACGYTCDPATDWPVCTNNRWLTNFRAKSEGFGHQLVCTSVTIEDVEYTVSNFASAARVEEGLSGRSAITSHRPLAS
jgi:hypothetical protein